VENSNAQHQHRRMPDAATATATVRNTQAAAADWKFEILEIGKL
jgi:hypothetical protein